MPSLNATCQQAKKANYGATTATTTTTTGDQHLCDCATQTRSISLIHSEEASRLPLLDTDNTWRYHDVDCRALLAAKQPLEPPATSKQRPARFRYFVAMLVLVAISVCTYANYTLYIAAIEMISNDVITSQLTELRRKHMSNDPLMVGHDAASPGTCPVETNNLAAIAKLKKALGHSAATAANLTALGLKEQQALAVDTIALFASVHERLAAGKLVDWSISERAYIFTAHNFGGILLAIPVGRLGLTYGSKRLVTICLVLGSARMLLLPVIAGLAPFWLMFLFEFFLGGPSCLVGILAYPLAAAWLLPDEANFFVALGQISQLIGNALTNFVSTQLLSNDISWPWCYYLPGIVLTLLTTLWMLLGADSPEHSRFVSQEERELIKQNSLATVNHLKLLSEQGIQQPSQQTNFNDDNECICGPGDRSDCPGAKTIRRPNWWTIFSCPTVWALILAHFAYHWNAKVATLWPTFFANILHMDPAAIGILTGLKGVVALLFGSTFVFFTRKFATRAPFGLSLTCYRRSNQLFATLTMAVAAGLMIWLDCDVWAIFASVLLTPVISSFNAISHEQMPLDLSAEDSGLLVSVIRMLSVGDLLALPVSSYILSYAPVSLGGAAGDRHTWRLVWALGLLVKIIAACFFVTVARSKPKRYSRLESSGPCKTIGRLNWSSHR